jgi:hypothetical protein
MVRLPKWLLVLASLAVLVFLAAPALAAEAKGKIKSVTPDKKMFVVTDTNGKDWEFTLADDAKVRLGDKEVKLNDIKKGDEVTITYEKKGTDLIATKVECKR